MFNINKDTVRAHSFLPLLVIKSYIIPKMARRTRKKGNNNNVINTAPPIVLAIMYSFKTAHQKNNRSFFVQKLSLDFLPNRIYSRAHHQKIGQPHVIPSKLVRKSDK